MIATTFIKLGTPITKFGHSFIIHDRITVQTVGTSTQIFRIKNGNFRCADCHRIMVTGRCFLPPR